MNNHKEAIQPIILLVTASLDYTRNGSGLIIAGWSVPHKLGGRERPKERLVLICFTGINNPMVQFAVPVFYVKKGVC